MNRTPEYQKYMKSAQWRNICNAAKTRAGHKCEICGHGSSKLEVHHKTYDRLGRERFEDLQVLCRTCHVVFDAERERAASGRAHENAFETYCAKKYGEDHYLNDEEDMRREFEEWLERKADRDDD